MGKTVDRRAQPAVPAAGHQEEGRARRQGRLSFPGFTRFPRSPRLAVGCCFSPVVARARNLLDLERLTGGVGFDGICTSATMPPTPGPDARGAGRRGTVMWYYDPDHPLR